MNRINNGWQRELPSHEDVLIFRSDKDSLWKFYKPGLTKTSYHTIFIYEKLLVIHFHTYRKLYENSMIGIFPYMKIV